MNENKKLSIVARVKEDIYTPIHKRMPQHKRLFTVVLVI